MDPDLHIAELRSRLESITDERTVEWGSVQYMLGLAIAEHPAAGERSYRESIRHYAKALRVFDADRFAEPRARVYTSLGVAERALGMGVIAKERFEQALALLGDSASGPDAGAAANNLGLVYEELGDAARAVDAFRSAIARFATAGADRQQASARHNLARVLAALGDHDGAMRELRAAITLTSPEGDGPLWASHVHELATHLLLSANVSTDHTEAIRLLRESLTVFTSAHHPFQYAMAKHNLGLAHAAMSGGDEPHHARASLACFEDALAIFDPRLHAPQWRESHSGLEAMLERLEAAGLGRDRHGHFAHLLTEVDSESRHALLAERLGRLWTLAEPARTAQIESFDRALVAVEGSSQELLTREWLRVLTERRFDEADEALAIRTASIASLDEAQRTLATLGIERALGDLEILIRMQVRERLERFGYLRPDGVS
ncbi:MAG: tetratricopeptide repeat protein [Acidimicrobiia bacterium]|nr:tetratricopeptide repeat protein [Acidimicrobiia bacterium]